LIDVLRVLIVDDEPPVIEGLAATIDREIPSYRVVGSAANGRQAIEKARELQPDVILLDVQMPGVDGIDALRTMREQGVQAIAILVTAYERFDVARRGYGLGVRDYLVKPVGPRTIREVLAKAESEIRQERERESHVVEMAEGKTRMLQTLERALLHLVLAGLPDSPAVPEMLSQLGLDGLTVVPVVIFVHRPPEAGISELAERLQYTVHGLVGVIATDRIVALAFHGKDSAAQVRERIERSLAFQSQSSHLKVQVADPVPLHQVAAVISHLSGSNRTAPHVRLHQLRGATVRAVRTGDILRAYSLFDEYVRLASRSGVVAEAVEALLVLAADAVNTHRGAAVDRALETILSYRKLSDTEGQVELARRHLAIWAQLDGTTQSLSSAVRAAVELVRNEFDRDLSIEGIAGRLQISPSHLSRTFSAQVGQPLSAYLADVRMQHASNLLRAQEHSVKEIATLCGYRDPNYFSRVFRAATGLSPSEYSKRRYSVET